ncbi:double-strand break repair protein AddB [Methyloligella sp. 2.7D]|uniref:double-strand break repair protein AddB n=1 Tax=unclassified Methyloligella TaxID=2625955 RepID=UPI00157BFA09|nr:double-strand break repair protein AddB [Methyloligella sp. GL2]QKP76057.1 double-strand break repair protein AddB [Methyloligella sp. GL2]
MAESRPRLYTIPPTAPFLDSLARAVLNGDLPAAGGDAPDPLQLPKTTIYLPTRRSARGLAQAFLRQGKRPALLLPRIRTLGDPEEEALFFEEQENDALPGAPAIDPLQRRLALMRLIAAWQKAMEDRGGLRSDPEGIGQPPITPAQASRLAADLARFMDFAETEEADLSRLKDLAPEELAEHWNQTIDFLEIVTKHWPAYLAEAGLDSPAARQTRLRQAENARLLETPPDGPVIAAGSTGTVPATARLLATIASLPNGAVVLPGLDLSLDEESWARLAAHPEHPQSGMAELLRRLEASRGDVAWLPGTEPDEHASKRLHFVSEVLRPAESTERWQHLLTEEETLEVPAGLRLIEAENPQDEAEAIALILRSVVERPEKTAALVTPDRDLARRVAARIKQFGLRIDDSAGLPLRRTVPGAFLDLILEAATSNFAPPQVMALLKHPLTRLGRSPAAIREAARRLERTVFRDVYLGQGMSGIRGALDPMATQLGRRPLDPDSANFRETLALVGDLEDAFAPMLALTEGQHSAASLAEAHIATAEALARDETGSADALWLGEGGESLSVLIGELMAHGTALMMSLDDYAPFYGSLVSGQSVRPQRGAHPRLFIWGPLEARMQRPDVVVLGGLNETVWPKPQDPGPWLNRAMMAELGLPAPERRIGLSAHDFAQSLGAPDVYLTRAMKVDGVPTVPSRWLQRLEALTAALGVDGQLKPERPWTGWARLRDSTEEFAPCAAPAPRPPLAARPRRLSVSRIQRWIANPYDIYAQDILKLRPLKPLGHEPDAALRGQVVHAALSAFTQAHPDALPVDIAGELVRFSDDLFAALGGSARVEAFWRPQFECFAAWFARSEAARREGVAAIHSERDGSLHLDPHDFTVTARADRIDIGEDGSAAIYDYKTGAPPAVREVDDGRAPQLPLEAAMLLDGGFGDVSAGSIAALRYIRASGRREGGEEREAGKDAPDHLAAAAVEALTGLVAAFNDEARAYEALRRPSFKKAYAFDDYAQLARVLEWGAAGGEGEE